MPDPSPSSPSPFTSTLDVPVEGGELRVGVAGATSGKPIVLAAHGISASHLAFGPVAEQLGDDVTFLAPDLRGRGASAALPGPFGMVRHADDLIAVLDFVGAVEAVLVGHSMGGFVMTRLATLHPQRASAVVLVDGGVPVTLPEGVDPQTVLDNLLGPAIERLRRTFPSREAYRDFWRGHPALSRPGAFSPHVQAYVDYDLVGEEPELRSRASLEAVREDGGETLVDDAVRNAVLSLGVATVLLRAPRGLQDDPNPLIPDDVAERFVSQVPGMVDEVVPDTNHYLIGMGERESALVADRIRTAAGLAAAPATGSAPVPTPSSP